MGEIGNRLSSENSVIFGALIKLLLFPAYYSTDFDVHRNWLAITHNSPLSEWYHEATSEWTLDYPPFFAYFEWVSSQFVPESAIQDGCLRIVKQDGQFGWPTIVFQRSTVSISELLLAQSLKGLNLMITALMWLNPAWLILDHMHFQYNAAMFGIFIISLRSMTGKRYLKSAVVFGTLICFKHIYSYVAPAYFVYLLKQYIFTRDSDGKSFSISSMLWKATKLGFVTLSPFISAFGPVFAADPDGSAPVLSRLFPFSRGSTHAYWAPNFWALYLAADRVLGIISKNSVEGATRGIVGQISFSNSPEIIPRHTFIVTVLLQLVSVIGASPSNFIEVVTLCGFASFLFGWHVHEKAIMVVVVPFALIVRKSTRHTRAFMPLSVSSCFSLFPSIWTPGETILKTAYTVGYSAAASVGLANAFSGWIGKINSIYSVIFSTIIMPASALIPIVAPKFDFAGLMLISVYGAVGVFWSWLQLMSIYSFGQGNETASSKKAATKQK